MKCLGSSYILEHLELYYCIAGFDICTVKVRYAQFTIQLVEGKEIFEHFPDFVECSALLRASELQGSAHHEA